MGARHAFEDSMLDAKAEAEAKARSLLGQNQGQTSSRPSQVQYILQHYQNVMTICKE